MGQQFSFNRRNVLLIVGIHQDMPPVRVWRLGDGVLRVAIDSFAPDDEADNLCAARWLAICQQAYAVVGGAEQQGDARDASSGIRISE